MTFLVDTSVWSLALRRNGDAVEPAVIALKDALLGADIVVPTGVILQELLQGFSGPKAKAAIIERFAALPLVQPDREGPIEAAEISFHGESVAEFEANFHAAIDHHLAASTKLDSAPEKPASGKLMLRIAPAVHAAALKAAARSGTSLNKWAESLRAHLAKRRGSRPHAQPRAATPDDDGRWCRCARFAAGRHALPRARRSGKAGGGAAGASIGSRVSAFTSFSTTLDRTWVTPGSLKATPCKKRS